MTTTLSYARRRKESTNELTDDQLIAIAEGIQVDGTLQVVTREDPPRSQFYFASRQSLFDNRRVLIERLDAMILAKHSGIYQSCNDRVHCPAYGYDPCTIQQEYIFL